MAKVRAILGLLIAVLLWAAPLAARAQGALPEENEFLLSLGRSAVFGGLMGVPPEITATAIKTFHDRGKPDVAATLILALRYNRQSAPAISDALAAITGEKGAHTWFDWMNWQEAHPEIVSHSSFARIKTELLTHFDPAFARFVPLSDNAAIRLEEVVWGGVGVDAIPALDHPKMIAPAEATYLIPGELVFGVDLGGDARAYPLRIMDWHEMMNDTVGGVSVALAYCTLCGSGILYDTRVDRLDAPLVFGTSGLLYRSNKLMFDRATGSLWNQFTGRPVSGPLAGSDIKLKVLPVVVTSWRDWLARHPDTRVLSLDTGYSRDYSPGAPYGHYFDSPDLMFPALVRNHAHAAKDYVFGVRAVGGAKAWPMEAFRSHPVINDTVGLKDVVIVGNAVTRTARAYARDGRTFAAGPSADTLSTGGETWRITEDALVGPGGTRLPRLAGHVAFWFAWESFVGQPGEGPIPAR